MAHFPNLEINWIQLKKKNLIFKKTIKTIKSLHGPEKVLYRQIHAPVLSSYSFIQSVRPGTAKSGVQYCSSGVFSTGAIAPIILRKRLIAPAVSTRNGKNSINTQHP